MVQKSALYASARVKARESRLVGGDRFQRMLDSPAEALKALYEISYADGMVVASPNEYGRLIDAEFESVVSFLTEVCPDGTVLSCLLKEYDYHNAKAFAKAKYMKLPDTDFMAYKHGNIDPDILKESILNDNYVFLPKPMGEALEKADFIYANGGKNPRLTDIALDKAMYADILAETDNLKDAKVKGYFLKGIDIANILTAVKCRLLSLGAKDYEEQFLPGGSVKEKACLSVLECAADAAAENFRYTEYYSLVERSMKNGWQECISALEVSSDDFLNGTFRELRHETSKIYPLLNFYLTKLSEFKNIRLIFTGLLNGADKSEIKKRLREV